MPPPTESAPLALCAAPNGDPYSIVVSMLRVCLREAGWRVVSLGADMPAAALRQALSDLRPSLLALSVSSVADEPTFLGEYRSLRETAIEHDTAIAIGGRALTAPLRRSLHYDFFGETLDHLVSFAGGLTRRRHR